MFKGASKHHVLLHFIVLIWGFTPILGRFISCPTMPLVWYRIAFTVIILSLYVLVIRQNLLTSFSNLLKLAGIGIMIAIHWLFFYGAIKVSNVSVTLAAFSTGTLFTSMIEPIVFKRKLIWYEFIIGFIIIGAIFMILSVENAYWLGIVLGILAAFTASIFNVFNGIVTKTITSSVITFYELLFGLIALSIYCFFNGDFTNEFFVLSGHDILGLSLLAGICTAFPFIASVNLLKYLSPYTITLTVNLETVYGIILAVFLYEENKELSVTFYIGVCIILGAVFLNAFLKSRSVAKAKIT